MATAVAPVGQPGLQLPEPLRKSYNDFESYPTNLILKNQFAAALTAYKKRLADFTPKLFKNGQSFVLFREFTGTVSSAEYEL
jgi:hypothetical protein